MRNTIIFYSPRRIKMWLINTDLSIFICESLYSINVLHDLPYQKDRIQYTFMRFYSHGIHLYYTLSDIFSIFSTILFKKVFYLLSMVLDSHFTILTHKYLDEPLNLFHMFHVYNFSYSFLSFKSPVFRIGPSRSIL